MSTSHSHPAQICPEESSVRPTEADSSRVVTLGSVEMRDTHRGRGGRMGVENPRRNLIAFKVSDNELAFLDVVGETFESRSEMIRTVLFDFAFALDPRKVKEHIDPEAFERLKQRLVEESA